jgi:hypothetical protein
MKINVKYNARVFKIKVLQVPPELHIYDHE